MSHSLSYLQEGRRASKMLSVLLGARLHTHIAEFVFPILLGSICFLVLACCLLDCSAPSLVWNMHMHRQGMGGRKRGVSCSLLKHERKKGNQRWVWEAMDEREKEMQDVGRCATWEKLNEEKGVCAKDKLEGERRETGRREHKKGVNSETEMKNSGGIAEKKRRRLNNYFSIF